MRALGLAFNTCLNNYKGHYNDFRSARIMMRRASKHKRLLAGKESHCLNRRFCFQN